jgi:hypothetical protein
MAVVRGGEKKMMATVVFPLCIEAHICSFLSFLFVFAFVLPFLYFSCPPLLCFSSFSFPSFVYLPFVLLCFFFLLFSSLYFPFLFSLFFFLSLILSLSGCPLFFILSFFFLSPPISSIFFHPPSSPGKGVFIGAGGARATLPLSSYDAGGVGASLSLFSHGDRVRWLGRPLCSHSQGMALLFFHYGGTP